VAPLAGAADDTGDVPAVAASEPVAAEPAEAPPLPEAQGQPAPAVTGRGGPRRWPYLVAGLLCGALVFGLAGLYLGALFEFNAPTSVNNYLAPLFGSKPASGLDTQSLEQVWEVIQRKYVRTNVSQGAAFDGAAKGLVGSLNTQFGDAFSAYLTPGELQRNREFLSGQFAGIGATMGTDKTTNRLMIVSVLHGTPAEKAGLKAGDIVTKIDGVDTTGTTVDQAVTKIRGVAGTQVNLTILRAGTTHDVPITRQVITVPTVYSHTFPKHVLYLQITDFGASTTSEFDTALRNGLNAGATKVVLDLRQNPGGYVNAADAVISEFVQSGKTVTLVGRDGSKEEHDVSGHGAAFTQKLAVLIDDQSASASEIVAGALKDNHRATLVGVKSFGKGSVQEDFNIRNGGDLHLTIALWYTPSGISIDKNGITPDRAVKLVATTDRYDVQDAASNPANDAQLQAALALLG